MLVSLVGLLLLQYSWIKNVHQGRVDQFETSINKTINSVMNDLDKIEKNVFHKGFPNRRNKSIFRNNNQLQFSNLIGGKNIISINDTIFNANNINTNDIVISGSSVDSNTGIVAEHKVVTKSLEKLINFPAPGEYLSSSDTTFSFPIQYRNAYEQNLLAKSRYLSEMAVKMFSSNLFDDITIRLNLNVLDTLIRSRLRANKVDTNFTFNIIDKSGEKADFQYTVSNYNDKLLKSDFSFKLFPRDFVSSDKYFLLLDFPNQKNFLAKQMWPTLLASILFVLIVVIAFYLAVATIFRQKKVSEIKNDFISNMTHELKTPISTISLACEAIEDPDVSANSDSMKSFISMISDENKRLGKLVEKVLQTSLLEKGNLKIQKQLQPIHNIIVNAVNSFNIQFERQGGKIVIEQVDEVYFEVDKVHFSNVIINLLDNALKYSQDQPTVRIGLTSKSKGFSITIADNGIGIKKEDHKRIFDKLYRVSTGDVHDVKGFGLGLDYVKSIINLHGGDVSVKSEYGKGSIFKIELRDE